jgi:hypothetical protein
MAVYQGARRRGALPLGLEGVADRLGRTGSPAASAPAGRDVGPAARRHGARKGSLTAGASLGIDAGTVTDRRRPSTVGIALAAIVLVFGAAFLTLSQSVRVAATGYDIVRLVSEQERLQAIGQDLRSDVNRLRSEPAIRKQALDAGLGQLGAPVIVQAR